MKEKLSVISASVLLLGATICTTGIWAESGFHLKSKKIVNPPPVLSTLNFEGEGTETSPYLIESLEHLKLLASNTRESEDFNYGTGLHYKLISDIDASAELFIPIGGDYHVKRFNGHFDGNGYTIKGLKVNTESAGFGGLFGSLGENAIVDNLNLSDVYIETDYYYSGGIAAYAIGATIRNCNVSGLVGNHHRYAGGIVGGSENAVVESCSFDGDVIASGESVGGVAGAFSGTMKDCHAVGNVRTDSFGNAFVSSSNIYNSVGGVIGQLYGEGSRADILSFAGNVKRNMGRTGSYVGGIVGKVVKGSISQAVSVGTVTGLTDYTGGIAGYLQGNASDVYSCVLVSDIKKQSNPALYNGDGGIAGYFTSYSDADGTSHEVYLKNTLFVGQLNVISSATYDPSTGTAETVGVNAGYNTVVGNAYYDKVLVNDLNSDYGAMSTVSLISGNGLEGFSGEIWDFGGNMYPRLKAIATSGVSQLASSTILLSGTDRADRVSGRATVCTGSGVSTILSGVGGESASKLDGNVLSVGDKFGVDKLSFQGQRTEYSKNISLKVCPNVFEGLGTADSPYLISGEEDLLKLANAVTAAQQSYTDAVFKQTADIILSENSAFKGIAVNDGADYLSYTFNGIYDGNGKTIDNFHPESYYVLSEGEFPSIDSNAKYGCVGFVGILGPKGSIHSLTMGSLCEVKGTGLTGAFAGTNYGKISNCVNLSPVTSYSGYAGGIAGRCYPGSSIVDCINLGSVNSDGSYTGGITGHAQGTLISGCMNTGCVFASRLTASNATRSFCGGIAGWAGQSTIVDVVNASTVSADKYVGGIVGRNGENVRDNWSGLTTKAENTIIRAVMYGTVVCPDVTTTGSVTGDNADSGTVAGVLVDVQLAGTNAVGISGHDGVVNILTRDFVSGTSPDGLDEGKWILVEGHYPVPVGFKDIPGIADVSETVILMSDHDSSQSISSPASLSENAAWSLSSGEKFSIEGNSLIPDMDVKSVYNDVISAKAGMFEKYIPIKLVPAIPLSGEGTGASPYIISSASDWNALADFMASVGTDMAGICFAITDDLEFNEDSPVKPLGSAQQPFNGNLNGRGHAVKGIDVKADCGYYGVFAATVGKSGRMANIIAEGRVSSSYDYLGGFIGTVEGIAENLVSKMIVDNPTGSVGGIASLAKNGALVIGCINEGTVSGKKGFEGGIVSKIGGGGATFEDCINRGTIADSGTSGSTIGGIAAYGASLSNGSVSFTRCANYGKFEIAKGDLVGGIYGKSNGTNFNEYVSFTDCENSADIIVTGGNAGGILGGTSINSAVAMKSPIIALKCVNRGNISTAGYAAENGTGGLFGMLTPKSVIRECVNYGEVSCLYYRDGQEYTGGIAGQSYTCGGYSPGSPSTSYARIVDCHNFGSISAKGSAGGIIGELNSYVYVDSCSNHGDVTVEKNIAGGIAGYCSGHWGHIKHSYNTADVNSENGAGGIIGGGNKILHITGCYNTGNVVASSNLAGGIAAEAAAQVVESYNLGSVTASTNAAGLVAAAITKSPLTGHTSFYRSYNAGIVKTDDPQTAGGIVTPGSAWMPDYCNTLKDTYFVTDLCPLGLNITPAVGITISEMASMQAFGNHEFPEALPMPDFTGSSTIFVSDYEDDDTDASGICFIDNYSLPVVNGNYHDHSALNAALVLPAEGEALDAVSSCVYIGKPDGVEWSASSGNVDFVNNKAVITKGFSGQIFLIAKAGEFEKTIEIYADTETSLDAIAGDISIVETVWFGPDGVKAAKPIGPDGKVYVVVCRFADGTAKAFRILND